ncbi:DUF1697 domain-containing protein [Loigolactobacillus zhaoyuanensis]|uniref:DUF1697 domain-containing protein n=1 Tax=Loigolactobacillus zhaoyuanensis TaxID=2486017 RepID=UPI000F74476F|nr:DUF1697 domain-containing protein [Loigolactobacillus zhaoyuanensis]
MRYLILLRGVNVGGNHRVVMAELRQQLTELGFDQVRSYINSGNLIIDSSLPLVEAQAVVTTLLATQYDFPVAALVIEKDVYLAELAQAPDWWGAEGDLRHNTLFFLPTFTPEMLVPLRQQELIYDQIHYGQHALFWTAPAKQNYSRSLYAKLLPLDLYPAVTIRNRNTTLKLAALLQN